MPVQISENRSLRSFLTFGMEARATQFVEVTSVAELREALELETENKLILGGGSNVLFVEEFDGLVIRNCIKGIEVLERDQSHVIISVGAGEIWHDLVSWCLDQDFGGLENLSLIPGTVGAAPIQNIGAYGVEQDEVIVSLDAVDMSTGERITFDKEACRFSYRDSIFKRAWKGQYCITKVRYKLTIHNHALRLAYGAIAKTVERLQIDEPTIKDVSAAVIGIRRSKLPDPKVLGNAGSFFKNPVITDAEFNQLKQRYPGLPSYPLDQGYVKVPAAWLIEYCGWKGYKSNGVGVYDKHALVLVNYGDGTAKELKALAGNIMKSVYEEFGIDLNPEVNIF